MHNYAKLGLALILGFSTGFVVLSSSSHACSISRQGTVLARAVFPKDAQLDVPTNAKIVIAYSIAAATVMDNPVIKTQTLEVVPSTVIQSATTSFGGLTYQTYVITPIAPLAATTRYLVQSDLGSVDAGVSGTLATSFTTGAGEDSTLPTMPATLDFSTQAELCEASACCGPFSGYTGTFAFESATDGNGPVAYELSRNGTVVLFPIPSLLGTSESRSVVRGGFLCSGDKSNGIAGMLYEEFRGESGRYSVVAVDLAGNRSLPIAVDAKVNCSTGDAGVPEDSGVVVNTSVADTAVIVPPTAQPDRSSGCRVSGHGQARVAWIPGLGLLGFVLVVRARRRR